MEEKRVTEVYCSFVNNIPEEKKLRFKSALEDAADDRYDELLNVKMKNSSTVAVMSVLVGVFGVDRFYLGDIVIGIIKLLFTVLSPVLIVVLCNLMKKMSLYMYFILFYSFAISIIWIVEIILCLKKAKEKNFRNLMTVLQKENSDMA